MHFRIQRIDLPEVGRYATGILFLTQDSYKQAKESFCDLAREFDLRVIAWRKLKVNSDCIGIEAKKTEPIIRQVYMIISIKNLKCLARGTAPKNRSWT